MENGRCTHAVSVVDGRLFVFGGTAKDFNALTSVECYDPIKKSWTPTTPLPLVRYRHGKSDKEDI